MSCGCSNRPQHWFFLFGKNLYLFSVYIINNFGSLKPQHHYYKLQNETSRLTNVTIENTAVGLRNQNSRRKEYKKNITYIYTRFTGAAHPGPVPQTAALTYGRAVPGVPDPSGPATRYTVACVVTRRWVGTWRSSAGGRLGVASAPCTPF